MKITVKNDELKMTDENMHPLTSLYVYICNTGETVDLCTVQPENGEQHDFSLSVKEWGFVKNFIDQKINQGGNR